MLVLFVAPFFSDSAKFFLELLSSLPDVRLGVIGQEDLGLLPADLRARIAKYARVEDALRTDHVVAGAEHVMDGEGPAHCLLGVLEQLQVPLGEARERLGLPGMRAAEAHNFRDKTRMKDVLRQA